MSLFALKIVKLRLTIAWLTLAMFIASCGRPLQTTQSHVHSLTSSTYSGKKYYLGFGRVMRNDPPMMFNEAKYDILHTYEHFTKVAGGAYSGKTLIQDQASRTTVMREWAALQSQITANDMYVQYSSGHGFPSGLEVGVSYDDIVTHALSLKAREIVIMTMACYSGGLVEAFNRRKSEWQNWQSQGRTLVVVSSSSKSQTSSTGPGTDPAQPGPNGSAGSAFGYSLWKSLTGDADGFTDGIKDGYLSIQEILSYTTAKTKSVGGHTPQVTGVYSDALVMSRVPDNTQVAMMQKNIQSAYLPSEFTAAAADLPNTPIPMQTRADENIYLALQSTSAANPATAVISVPEMMSGAAICTAANSAECRVGSPSYIPATLLKTEGGRKFFSSQLTPSDGKQFFAVGINGTNNVYKKYSLKAKAATTPNIGTVSNQVIAQSGTNITFQDLKLQVPAGAVVEQEGASDGGILMVFRSATAVTNLYTRRGPADLSQMTNTKGTRVTRPAAQETIAGKAWNTVETSYATKTAPVYAYAFNTTINGVTYYGYSRAATSADAKAAATALLQSAK